jgi:hypothetical protein
MDRLGLHNDGAAERLTPKLDDQLCLSPWWGVREQRGTASMDAIAMRLCGRPSRRLRAEILESPSDRPPMVEAATRYEGDRDPGDVRRSPVIPLHPSPRRRLQNSSKPDGHAGRRSTRGAACAGQEMESASVIGCGPGAVRSERGIERDPWAAG